MRVVLQLMQEYVLHANRRAAWLRARAAYLGGRPQAEADCRLAVECDAHSIERMRALLGEIVVALRDWSEQMEFLLAEGREEEVLSKGWRIQHHGQLFQKARLEMIAANAALEGAIAAREQAANPPE